MTAVNLTKLKLSRSLSKPKGMESNSKEKNNIIVAQHASLPNIKHVKLNSSTANSNAPIVVIAD